MITHAITITFGFIVLACLIRIFCKGDTKDKTFQKIIGGFTVFIVAILSNNVWVFIPSLFIGGLIIASENFMILLAAIMKSSGKNVPESIRAINSLIKNSTPEEVKEKKKQAIKEIKEIDKAAEKLSVEVEGEKENFIIAEADYDSILPKIENMALDKVEKSVNKSITRQLTFSNPAASNDSFTFDGTIIDNEGKTLRVFEVKTFPKLPRNKHGRVMTFAIVENIRESLFLLLPKIDNLLKNTLGWNNTLTMVIVLNTKSDFIKIRRRIEEIRDQFDKTIHNFRLNFIFYNLKNMDTLAED